MEVQGARSKIYIHETVTPNRDLLGYNVLRDGTVIGFTASTSYDDGNVQTDVEYCYADEAVYDDGSCQYDDECNACEDVENQLDCMAVAGCMWMGDHCMESNDDCIDYETQLDCMNGEGCFWMGDHCMSGSNCVDPIAFNYNPIADVLGDGDNSSCQYSAFINFGCTYEDAINFDETANVDDGSCEYLFGDTNKDGIVNVLDIIEIVNVIMDMF